ncbi:MAG: sugar ABC transporter ATP-binding protein, partial [Clostridia bacterium]|nr:sugar ABC transporter ATP-binding protein [Clostridia bacterium]
TTEKIIRLMVGRELSEGYPKRSSKTDEVLFSAEGLIGEYSRLKSASLTLYKGEILGIAGLDGSGRTELLEAIFGISKLRSGRLMLRGKEIKNRSPREAIKNGFALLTEERRRSGIFGILDINANTVISSLDSISGLGVVSDRRAREATEKTVRRLRVKVHTEKEKIRNLSGGNQQKVILGRWLLTKPSVLLLDEPTRGVDVGAKYEIYSILASLSSEGRGIIVVSSEMPELLGICDRIAVMSGGRIAGELDARQATQEEIMTLAARFAE